MTDEETTGEIESKPGGSSVMDLLRHRRQLRAQEIKIGRASCRERV